MSDTSSPNAPVTLPEEMEKLLEAFRRASHRYGASVGIDRISPPPDAAECRAAEAALRSAIAELSREREMAKNLLTLSIDDLAEMRSRLREVGRERDEALALAAGPSSLRDVANGFNERGFRIRELEEALRTYGRHKDGCWLLPDCVCGFEKFSPAPIFRAKRPTSTETDNER